MLSEVLKWLEAMPEAPKHRSTSSLNSRPKTHRMEGLEQLHPWRLASLVPLRDQLPPEARIRLPMQLEGHPDDGHTDAVRLDRRS